MNILDILIPIDSGKSNIVRARFSAMWQEIINIYNLLDMKDTPLKILVSVANYESHRIPLRDTGNSQIYIDRVFNGMCLTNDVFKIIKRRFM